MRTVGQRKQHQITYSASAELLIQGAGFNEEMQKLPTGGRTYIRKGTYRFKTHEEANRHEFECNVESIVRSNLEHR